MRFFMSLLFVLQCSCSSITVSGASGGSACSLENGNCNGVYTHDGTSTNDGQPVYAQTFDSGKIGYFYYSAGDTRWQFQVKNSLPYTFAGWWAENDSADIASGTWSTWDVTGITINAGGGTTGGGSSGDPHLRLPHGGRADFRGYHNATVSFVSSKDVALNVKTENATFKLGQTTVAGSFITEAHLAMRTHPKDSDAAFRWFNVSFWADHLNKDGWAWDLVTGSCAKAGNPPVPFQLGYHAEKRCDDLVVTTDWSSATVDTAEWRFVLRGQPVYDRLAGPRHRVDVEVTQKVADREFAVPPHGLVGQAYDGDGKPRAGRLDAYPPRHVNGTFATSAMAEGAIDGVAADYVVASPYETRFKYSAFDYPTAPAAAAAVEAKRAAMAVGDGQLRAAGAVERE